MAGTQFTQIPYKVSFWRSNTGTIADLVDGNNSEARYRNLKQRMTRRRINGALLASVGRSFVPNNDADGPGLLRLAPFFDYVGIYAWLKLNQHRQYQSNRGEPLCVQLTSVDCDVQLADIYLAAVHVAADAESGHEPDQRCPVIFRIPQVKVPNLTNLQVHLRVAPDHAVTGESACGIPINDFHHRLDFYALSVSSC